MNKIKEIFLNKEIRCQNKIKTDGIRVTDEMFRKLKEDGKD